MPIQLRIPLKGKVLECRITSSYSAAWQQRVTVEWPTNITPDENKGKRVVRLSPETIGEEFKTPFITQVDYVLTVTCEHLRPDGQWGQNHYGDAVTVDQGTFMQVTLKTDDTAGDNDYNDTIVVLRYSK